MSLKIERDTIKETVKEAVINKGGFVGSTAAAVAEAATGNLPGTSGKHPLSAVVGTAITGGRQNAGTKGYLAVCFVPQNPPRCAAVTGVWTNPVPLRRPTSSS
jgi:hypothetical protein